MENHCVEVERFKNWLVTDNNRSENTANTYGHEVGLFADWLDQNGGDLSDLTRFDVQAYVKALEKAGKSAATIEKKFNAISKYADYVQQPEITADIRRIKPSKRNQSPESLSKNDYNALLRKVEQSGSKRDMAIVRLLLNAGLRVAELCALDRQDIEISDRKGSVTVRGKGHKERRVPLLNEARRALRQYLDERKDDLPPLFLSTRGNRISTRTVQHMLANYGTHPHALRHTFCRQLVANGQDIATVADLAGHEDINVTRRYARSSADEQVKAMEQTFD